MADQRKEPLSGSLTARMLRQQPIPVFDRVRTLARSSADFFEILGRPRIAARLPSENLRGVSAEKGKFSVSRTVRTSYRAGHTRQVF